MNNVLVKCILHKSSHHGDTETLKKNLKTL